MAVNFEIIGHIYLVTD